MVKTIISFLPLLAFLLIYYLFKDAGLNTVKFVLSILKIRKLLRKGNPFKASKQRIAAFIVPIASTILTTIQFINLSYQIIRCKD